MCRKMRNSFSIFLLLYYDIGQRDLVKNSHEVDVIVGSACTRGFAGDASGGGRGARAQHVRACGSHAPPPALHYRETAL